MPGKWRKEPFSRRVYEPISHYVVSEAVQKSEAQTLLDQLNTPLDGYLGQSYNYDDFDLTEEWMCTFRDNKVSGPSEDDVIRTQLVSLMEIMMVQVQDRVCTEEKVLARAPLVLGKDVVEVPVWGIDCYTRRMIEITLEDRLPKASGDIAASSTTSIKKFVERVLLPTINKQPSDQAHNMACSLNYIRHDPLTSELDKTYASCLLDGIEEYGIDIFRIHPKGTGVVCINPNGIAAHVVVSEYLGELYPPYRWCERLDVIEQAQKTFELKPALPDFYNILLERPRQDPEGYGLLYVDASQKANIGSSCSHSCASNCTSAVVAKEGKLVIVLTTNRHIYCGEELTMDYYSITTSDAEWRAAVCLCGMSSCRGSFLSYATQDDLQQVLNQNFGPVSRYSSLLRACSHLPVRKTDEDTLCRHGMGKVALGATPPSWMTKYAADILRFIEYERKALPCALLRPRNGFSIEYSYSSADMDARVVMEQRIQSMVCCFSMISRVLSSQPESHTTSWPLISYSVSDVVKTIWKRLCTIPTLLTSYLLNDDEIRSNQKKTEKRDSKLLEELKVKAQQVIEKIENILSAEPGPTGLVGIRDVILNVRKILIENESLSTPKARLGQLADVLVLWAFTSNFSCPKEYDVITSDPIIVPARELGTGILRTKIFKPINDRKTSKKKSDETAGFKSKSPSVADFEADTTTESVEYAPSPTLNLETENASQTTIPQDALSNQNDAGNNDKSLLLTENQELASNEVIENKSLVMSDPVDCLEEPSIRDASSSAVEGSFAKSESELYLTPNEPIFQGRKVYDRNFCFWQLIGWFNAGTDQKIDAPDLFGCVELPEPAHCFGTSELPYGEKQREMLLNILKSPKLQSMTWPALLKSSFSQESLKTTKKPLYGSPMLDAALGQVDSVFKALAEFKSSEAITSSPAAGKTKSASAKKGKSKDKKEISLQLDDILPPEKPTSWVQCEQCKKWRRVPWHVDAESLPDTWQCNMNTWDQDVANCEAPQDGFDPNVENTVEMKTTEKVNTLEACKIGAWRDLFCTKNRVYYEAQIVKIKAPKRATGKTMVLFHYKGWSRTFDEWVPFDSDRIAAHNLHTSADFSDPRDQEAYQGMEPIVGVKIINGFKKEKALSNGAFSVNSGRKRRLSGIETSENSPKKPLIDATGHDD